MAAITAPRRAMEQQQQQQRARTDADCRACAVQRAQMNTALAHLTAAQEAGGSRADIMQHVMAACDIMTRSEDAIELRPSIWKGMKAVPKGEGKGKDIPFTPGLTDEERQLAIERRLQERDEERFRAMQAKGKGKGLEGQAYEVLLTPGEGERGTWVRARTRSPVPDWVPVAFGDQMPITPPGRIPPSPQTPE